MPCDTSGVVFRRRLLRWRIAAAGIRLCWWGFDWFDRCRVDAHGIAFLLVGKSFIGLYAVPYPMQTGRCSIPAQPSPAAR